MRPRGGIASIGVVGAGLLVLHVGAAAAQGLGGGAGVFNVQRRVAYQGGVYQQTGALPGAAGTVRLGRFSLTVSGWMGSLSGEASSANPGVKLRTGAVALRLHLTPWASVSGQAEARRFEADAGVTLWRLIGGSLRIEPGLGLEGLSGLAEVAFLPASSVTNGPSIKTAFQLTSGVRFAPAGFPLYLSVGYRFERYDMQATGTAPERYEQFRGVVAEVGVRLGR